MLYHVAKILVRLALLIFCRRIAFNDKTLLKEKGPLLLACNHPNSFLDALIIGTISSLTEIKIPDDLKERIQLNEEVSVLLIPLGERLYEDWKDDEWNQLSVLNDEGE